MLSETSAELSRVLVIEDDAAQREVLSEALEMAGYQVTGAEHGKAALELLLGGLHPDVIVLDLLLPVMDGWSFRLEQRKHPSWGRIPVVVLSSENSPQAAAMDAAAFLRKPVDFGQLVEVARGLIAAAARERMEQTEKMATLGVLAAGVAHEISNPISYTLASLDFARGELEDWTKSDGAVVPVPRARLEDVLAAVCEAGDGADRVKGIVGELRIFARSDVPRRKPVDVEAVARCALKLATPHTKHRAEVVTEFGEAPAVMAEEPKLVQVLLNLIVNAAQALSEGQSPPRRIVVRTGSSTSGMAFIEVADTGEGIAPGLLERIFEPFFTTKPPGVGTGLGLAICRKIAREHGGELTVESELGHGSRFRLELPALSP